MSEPFTDPPHKDEIIQRVKECKTPEDIEKIIISTFPGWIRTQLHGYSRDYHYLQRNWEMIASRTGATPRKILLIEYINTSPNHCLIRLFAEIMTQGGYCVRTINEFGYCPACQKAIPKRELWERLKERECAVPDEWSEYCKGCM